MPSDFSRTLALLRKEKKISQRSAATELEVSQALLSHYENGLREPGLSFVVRAANYYDVSCDYLLGRSMARDGSAVAAEHIPDASDEKGNVLRGSVSVLLYKKMLVNSVAVLLELCGKFGSRQLTSEVAEYLSIAIYKAFRCMYMANPENAKAAFRITEEDFGYLCNAHMQLNELRMRAAARGVGGYGLDKESVAPPMLSLSEIANQYTGMAQSLLTLLQTVSDHLIVFDESVYKKQEKRKGG